MKIGVYYVESDNVLGESINKSNRELIERLSEMTGTSMEFVKLEDVGNYDVVLDFIGGGGTEGAFLKVLDKLPRPVFMITTGANNSLAASMEILSYLRQNGIPGEIIHGSDEFMADRIRNISKVFKAIKTLSNFRIGRVGKPSDWLISSDVNAEDSKEVNGIEIVDIPMEEFFEEINRHEYEENEYTRLLMNHKWSESEKVKALEIYGALKRICVKYGLQGVTVRCFDLLTPVKGTGCAALAILNSEGIYASCEGDVPALISMAVLGELTGQPVFMANPSRILTDTNEIVFAHCTLPITMGTEFEIMTHFESGLGVAFRAHIAEGPVTVFKTSGMLDEYFVSGGILEANLSETNLCRTQIQLKLDESVEYFLTESIGNHHLIINGDYVDLVHEFFKWF